MWLRQYAPQLLSLTEPLLLPTAGVTLPPGSNTTNNGRVDVSARSIWNPLEIAFLDLRVYQAQAPSNRNLKTIPRMYSHHKEQKKRAYNAQILEVYWREEFSRHYFTQHLVGWERRLKPIQEGCSKDGQSDWLEVLRDKHIYQKETALKATVITLRGYRDKPLPSSSTEISELDMNQYRRGLKTFICFNFIVYYLFAHQGNLLREFSQKF